MENYNINPNDELEIELTESELNEIIKTGLASMVENTSDSLSNAHGENLRPETIEEVTDKERYEDVIFLQGDEAVEALEILHNDGQDAALEYLKQWHNPGNGMGKDEPGVGNMDKTYVKDGYMMSWNTHIPYVGLTYDTKHELAEDSQMQRHQASQRGKIGGQSLGQHGPHFPNR